MKRLLKSDASFLIFAGIAAQVVNLAAYPFLTRVYSPDSFGIYSAITGIANLVGSAILLRLDVLVQIVEPEDVEDILFAATIVGMALFSAVAGVLLVSGEIIFGALNDSKEWHPGYALVIPVLALLNGIFALARQYAARSLHYRRLSAAKFLQVLLMVLGQLVLAFLLPGHTGLLAGFGLGLFLAAVLIWPLPRNITAAAWAAPVQAIRRAWAVVDTHRAYIRVDLPNILFATAAFTAFPVIVLLGFGAIDAGFFAVASRLVLIPVSVLAGAVSTIYFQRFSVAVREREGMLHLFSVAIFGAISLALFIAGFVVLLADPFVKLVFPQEWSRVSEIMVVLLPIFVVRFVILCVGSTPLSLKRPFAPLMWNILQLCVILISWGYTRGAPLEEFFGITGLAMGALAVLYLGFVTLLVVTYAKS